MSEHLTWPDVAGIAVVAGAILTFFWILLRGF
jgi:hypothetical protein